MTGSPGSERADEREDLAEPMVARPGSVRPVGARSVFWLPALTLVIGLAVTAVLAITSHSQYTSNEKRLLTLRVRDATALITAGVPGIQTPLASAAELADVTNGNIHRFMRFAASYVGTGPGKQFKSLSLWRLSAPQRGPVAVEGAPPELAKWPSTAASYFAGVLRHPQLTLIGFLSGSDPRIGYTYVTPGVGGDFAAYGEAPLPANRQSRLQSSNEFAGLHYAIYLGANQRPANLLVADTPRLPLPGLKRAQVVPFGNTAFTLAMSTQRSLAGSLPQRLPWIIAIGGVVLTLLAAGGTIRLVQRRRDAERLATRLEVTANEIERLYSQQRGIAQTLQHALLPDRLPEIAGIETSARYEAGEAGVDIGGDWYDVIDLEDGRVLLIVGDVSGRGLRAATTMALLRYAIHAYAAQHDDPAEILTKLSHLMNIAETGQLATILCAMVDVERHQITLTSAGHLPPLLIQNGSGEYVETRVGLPIGVEQGASYSSTTVSAPAASTLVAFTDGLVEHRGEDLDESLARLRQAAVGRNIALSELLGRLVEELQSGAGTDDIAIVGLRWTN